MCTAQSMEPGRYRMAPPRRANASLRREAIAAAGRTMGAADLHWEVADALAQTSAAFDGRLGQAGG